MNSVRNVLLAVSHASLGKNNHVNLISNFYRALCHPGPECILIQSEGIFHEAVNDLNWFAA